MARPDCTACTRAAEERVLSFEGFDPRNQGTREALLGLANGYLATRGALPEATADGVHYPATYVAGIYNRLRATVDGHDREDESIVNLPNWLPFVYRHEDGDWMAPDRYTVVHHHELLDLRHSIHWRETLLRDDSHRATRLVQQRALSMARPHLAALRTTITPLNWSGVIQVRSGLDARVTNGNVAEYAALPDRHLSTCRTGSDADSIWLLVETNQSCIRIAVSDRTTMLAGESQSGDGSQVIEDADYVARQFTIEAQSGAPITFDKIAAVFTSRDNAISEPLDAAHAELAAAPTVSTLLTEHTDAWERHWSRHQLTIDGPDCESVRQSLDVHLFHIAQTLSHHTADLDVGVPARGLHGEGYRGHIFWDELFVFPHLNLRSPELTRALLLYRYRRLPRARILARDLGADGALFPWQSGSDGREETPEWFYNSRSGRWMKDNSRRQWHVNLAVAYNVWHYWQVTADADFMAAYGAELLVEQARFWSSIVRHDATEDRYHIDGVMGPDEFHDGHPDRPGAGLVDNAYVNVMTAWALSRARAVYDALGGHQPGDVWDRLGVTAAELARWDHIGRRLHVPFLDDGLLAQFEGYGDLDELDWERYRARYGNIGRLDLILESENDSTNHYKASKQADVLMLLYLLSAEELTATIARLGYPFDSATIPATVDYYLARTTHGSTLSHVAHAWVLARSNRRASWALFRDALRADLDDTQGGSTREGIHLGAMAATADILQRCYTGLETRDDALWLNPLLPEQLHSLEFDVHYRGHWLHMRINHDHLRVDARPSTAPPIMVMVADHARPLAGGERLEMALRRG